MQRTILANSARLILAMLCCMVVGCVLPQRQFQGPQTIQQQQLSATSFDPYADVDAAPEIVGARPREFQRPAAEPERTRAFQDTRWPF